MTAERDAGVDDATVDTDLEIVLVAAVAENGVIGRDGGMPWHYSEDLKHFKRTTTGHPVIVGRKTYETVVDALGEPFPDRTSVVLSSRSLDLPEGAVLANSVADALERAEADAEERGVETAYVAGGGRVYEQFLPYATRLVLTEIDGAYEGDTRFPVWNDEEWIETSRESHDEFDFVTYERVEE
ncbi:dihydrofolate reductase [Halobellus limi]|uniref:dihydrofolate reductase n=1 Tax=Halobellus limi TaxID=699433 RepID=A0A1H5ZST5_9EURY|nr:dihydrofolate reductase [Halobellus limi]QCC48932.1 dihydrofolate reductase [Halobellus limi]SEG39054.1 dihydrofolate reductase [Halobellus limi]